MISSWNGKKKNWEYSGKIYELTPAMIKKEEEERKKAEEEKNKAMNNAQAQTQPATTPTQTQPATTPAQTQPATTPAQTQPATTPAQSVAPVNNTNNTKQN